MNEMLHEIMILIFPKDIRKSFEASVNYKSNTQYQKLNEHSEAHASKNKNNKLKTVHE